MTDFICVIFAGGKSSRMGEDKALLPFGNFSTLTEFQLTRLKKIFKTVYVSCKDKAKFDFQADFIEDLKTDDVFAPTIGFVTVFETLACERFFAISVDTPFLDEKTIKKIIDSDTHHAQATIAKIDGKIQPICGIYHRQLQEKFITMLNTNNHKLGNLLKNSKTTFVEFEDKKPFTNLNHPHEYKEALLTPLCYNTKK